MVDVINPGAAGVDDIISFNVARSIIQLISQLKAA
jgi:hypothetical protein